MQARLKQIRAFCVAMALAALASQQVSAEIRKWTGDGDGTNLSDPLNWDEKGAPQSGGNDIVYLYNNVGNTTGVFNNDIEGLTINELRFEGDTTRTFTLKGNDISFVYNPAGNLQARIIFLASSSADVDVGIVTPSDSALLVWGKNHNIPWKNFCYLSLNGIISGEGGVQYRMEGRVTFKIKGENTYSGGTELISCGGTYYDSELGTCDTGGIFAYTTTAFGTYGTVTVSDLLAGTDTIRFDVPSGSEFGYDFILSAKRYLEFSLLSSSTFTGNFSAESYEGQTMSFITSSAADKPVYSGNVTLPGGTLKLMAYPGGSMEVTGKVKCAKVSGSAKSYTRTGGAVLSGDGSDYDEMVVQTTSLDLTAPLPEDLVVQFNNTDKTRNDTASGTVFDLTGLNQSIDRLWSVEDPQMSSKIQITSSDAAQLTMNATEDAMLAVPVNGNVSLIWKPNSYKKLTIKNAQSMTAGSLTVASGEMALAGSATFANVSEVTVAENAVFDLSTETAKSLVGVRRISVGNGGTVKFASSAVSPLAETGVRIDLASGATLDIGEGIALNVADLFIDGIPVAGGTYFNGGALSQIKGLGSITVQSKEVATKPASWTGGGADSEVSSLANWSEGVTADDLLSGGLYPTFAQSGSEANISSPVAFKGIVFDIPGGGEENVFTLRGTGPISLYGLGINVNAPQTEGKFVYTLDVPISIMKPLNVDISSDADVTLAVKKPLSGPYTVETMGEGTLRLEAESPNFTGDITLGCDKVEVFAATNAFGSADAGGKILYDGSTVSSLVLNGTVIDRPFDWRVSAEIKSSALTTAANTTNRFTGAVELSDCGGKGYPYINVGGKDGVLAFDGTFSDAQSANGFVTLQKLGGGTLQFNGSCSLGTLLYIYAGWVEVNTDDCKKIDGYGYSMAYALYGGNVRFGKKNAFYGNGHTRILLGGLGGTVDLGGFDVEAGMFALVKADTDSPCTLTSPTRATYRMKLNGNMPATKVALAGEASLFVDGVGTTPYSVTLDVPATTMGTLTVSNANVTLTANASWLNPTNGVVSVGGERGSLSITKSDTFSKKMAFSLGGAAKLTLADGVVQKCSRLYLDGTVAPNAGTWGATGSGAENIDDVHFAGKGVLLVKRCGVMLIVR